MVENLSAKKAIHLMICDFKSAWNNLASVNNHHIGRGNFIFGFMAMNLLEYICRLCISDSNALSGFSDELNKIEPKYFIHLPANVAQSRDRLDLGIKRKGFTLPYKEEQARDNMLLTLLFDLIRNGIGHQYQQIVVDLNNGANFFITLDGPSYKNTINGNKRWRHLFCRIERNGDIRLTVYPQILLVDFELAVKQSNLLDRNLSMTHFKRYYNVSASLLEDAIRRGGLDCFVMANNHR